MYSFEAIKALRLNVCNVMLQQIFNYKCALALVLILRKCVVAVFFVAQFTLKPSKQTCHLHINHTPSGEGERLHELLKAYAFAPTHAEQSEYSHN